MLRSIFSRKTCFFFLFFFFFLFLFFSFFFFPIKFIIIFKFSFYNRDLKALIKNLFETRDFQRLAPLIYDILHFTETEKSEIEAARNMRPTTIWGLLVCPFFHLIFFPDFLTFNKFPPSFIFAIETAIKANE